MPQYYWCAVYSSHKVTIVATGSQIFKIMRTQTFTFFPFRRADIESVNCKMIIALASTFVFVEFLGYQYAASAWRMPHGGVLRRRSMVAEKVLPVYPMSRFTEWKRIDGETQKLLHQVLECKYGFLAVASYSG